MASCIIGILLAAGESTRFGTNKLLHLLPDSKIPIAVQSAKHILQALPDSIAVVREDNLQLNSLLQETDILLIGNRNAELGMSSSICCAIKAVKQLFPAAKGCVMALADMPYISPGIIKQVADSIQAGELIAAPQYKNQRGHPVGFSYQLFDELLTLQGDVGAKSLLDKYSSQLYVFETSQNGILRDIDRPDDLTHRD